MPYTVSFTIRVAVIVMKACSSRILLRKTLTRVIFITSSNCLIINIDIAAREVLAFLYS